MGHVLNAKLTASDGGPFDKFYLLSAFVKRSGVHQLKDALAKFQSAGGTVAAVVGVDARGTSREGLEALLAVTDDAWVYHDRNKSRTFHPKIYVFEQEGVAADVYTGSSNLTYGGLFSNSELNVHTHYDLSSPIDQEAFAFVIELFESFANHTDCARRLDEQLIEQLDQRGMLGPESSIGGGAAAAASGPAGVLTPLFGTAPEAITFAPPQAPTIQASTSGFWKKLSKNDVSETSSPGQIIIPIAFAPLFPALGTPKVTPRGATQSDTYFDVVFRQPGASPIVVEGARGILYVPAPDHPRPNKEYRFTFRSRDILGKLRAGDVLQFRRTDNETIWFEVTRLPQGSAAYEKFLMGRGASKFGTL